MTSDSQRDVLQPVPDAKLPAPDGLLGRDLWVRSVAAAIMATATLSATVWGIWPFTAILIGLGLVAAWEWNSVTRTMTGPFDRIVWVHASLAIAATVATALGYVLPAVLALVIVASVLAFTLPSRFAALGILATGIPALALVCLRRDASAGLSAVLFVFMVVWVTDTAALVWGRSIGGARLWPSISPNKTWAGAIGGAATAVLAGIVFAWITTAPSLLWLIGLALLLSIAAQCGDLAMSALKRHFHRKDTSHLIPGHGGMLDRVDGLLLAATVAWLLALMLDARHPGAALLGL